MLQLLAAEYNVKLKLFTCDHKHNSNIDNHRKHKGDNGDPSNQKLTLWVDDASVEKHALCGSENCQLIHVFQSIGRIAEKRFILEEINENEAVEVNQCLHLNE